MITFTCHCDISAAGLKTFAATSNTRRRSIVILYRFACEQFSVYLMYVLWWSLTGELV